MHKIKYGNILEAEKGFIVHGCNCQGVQGAGLAQQIRLKYPQTYTVYREDYLNCQKKPKLGTITATWVDHNKIIVNALTQETYGRDPNTVYVDYDAIRSCFEKVLAHAKVDNLPIHYPKIGAGLANGNWDLIYNTIKETLGDHDHYLWLQYGR